MPPTLEVLDTSRLLFDPAQDGKEMSLKYLDKLLENPHEFGARMVKFSDRKYIFTVNEHLVYQKETVFGWRWQFC